MKKNKMKECIMCLVLAVMLGISGIIPTAPVLKTEAASLSAADDSQTVIGWHRLHDTSYAAVQVGNKIYYSSDRTGYIFCYDVKKKTNKKLAKLPKQVRNKNTYYSYKNYANISNMFYYKGYLYCGLMDGLMCYGIIRVNVKNGKVKKLFFERSSSSVLPEPGFEFSIYKNKIYYAYSNGTSNYNYYFASMNLDGSHKKVISQKALTKVCRNVKDSRMIVYRDAVYVYNNFDVFYKINKKGKKTKIKNLPKTYMKVKVSTSGCVIDGEKAQYKGYEYDSMGSFGLLNKKNIATGEEKAINSSSSERRSYIVLGDYILLRKNKAKKKLGECKITLQLLNNKGKKIKDLYSYNVNYNE